MRSIFRSFWAALLFVLCGRVAFADAPHLSYDELPELKQLWEIPLESYGFVAFMPKGDKGVFLDKESITVFHPKTGKKTRQIPHNFKEPHGVSCSESDLCVWRSAPFQPYESSTAKFAGATRSVGLKVADPRYSPDGDFLACVTGGGPLLFSTETGEWGKPLASLELDETVAALFLENGQRLFAVNKSGEYVIADVPSGKLLSKGTLPEWPKGYQQFPLRTDSLRALAARPSDNELLVANGTSILVYDLNVLPVLDRTIRTSLAARFLEIASAAPVGVAVENVSTHQTHTLSGVAAIPFDTRSGRAYARLPASRALPSVALSPDGTLLLGVQARSSGKTKPVKWFVCCWATGAPEG